MESYRLIQEFSLLLTGKPSTSCYRQR